MVKCLLQVTISTCLCKYGLETACFCYCFQKEGSKSVSPVGRSFIAVSSSAADTGYSCSMKSLACLYHYFNGWTSLWCFFSNAFTYLSSCLQIRFFKINQGLNSAVIHCYSLRIYTLEFPESLALCLENLTFLNNHENYLSHFNKWGWRWLFYYSHGR